MISTRSAGLVIDTVVCLTIAKWETVSGRFGGYLTRIRLYREIKMTVRKLRTSRGAVATRCRNLIEAKFEAG